MDDIVIWEGSKRNELGDVKARPRVSAIAQHDGTPSGIGPLAKRELRNRKTSSYYLPALSIGNGF